MSTTINADRLIPEGGINPYADHPGFIETTCRLRMTITRRSAWGGLAGGGFACEMTGGHCLPGDECVSRRERADRDDELAALCAESKAKYPTFYIAPQEPT